MNEANKRVQRTRHKVSGPLTRDVVHSIMIKSAIILLGSLYTIGCAYRARPIVNLPIASMASGYTERDSHAMDVIYTGDNEVWIGKYRVPQDDIQQYIDERRRNNSNIKASIHADKTALYWKVQNILEICRDPHTDRATLIIGISGTDIEKKVSYSVIFHDHIPQYVIIKRTPHGMALNDMVYPDESIIRLLSRLATIDSKAPVLYLSNSHDTVQDVVDILTLCFTAGLENIYVLDRWPRETVYYDAQQPGAGYPPQGVGSPEP